MDITSTGWSTDYGYVRVNIVQNSGIKALDSCGPRLLEAIGNDLAAGRAAIAAHERVRRLSEDATAEAVTQGAAGKKVDHKAIKRRREVAHEAVEAADLDKVAASAHLSTVHSEYVTTLLHHAPALRRVARDEMEGAMLALTTALEIVRRNATLMGAGVDVLTSVSDLAHGTPRPATPFRTQTDVYAGDAGHPGIHASSTEEPIQLAIAWAHRWVKYADEKEAADKAAAKEAKAQAKAEAQEAGD